MHGRAIPDHEARVACGPDVPHTVGILLLTSSVAREKGWAGLISLTKADPVIPDRAGKPEGTTHEQLDLARRRSSDNSLRFGILWISVIARPVLWAMVARVHSAGRNRQRMIKRRLIAGLALRTFEPGGRLGQHYASQSQ